MNVKSKDNRKSGQFRAFITSTSFLTNGLLIIGGAILLLGTPVIQWALDGRMPEQYLYLLMCISLSFFLTSGFFTVVRREMPRPGKDSIKGFWAVLGGGLMIVASVICEMVFVFQIIKILITK